MNKHRYRSVVLRRFEFSSALQRMSVVAKNTFDERLRVFTKGSPEKVSELCRKETLPDNF